MPHKYHMSKEDWDRLENLILNAKWTLETYIESDKIVDGMPNWQQAEVLEPCIGLRCNLHYLRFIEAVVVQHESITSVVSRSGLSKSSITKHTRRVIEVNSKINERQKRKDYLKYLNDNNLTCLQFECDKDVMESMRVFAKKLGMTLPEYISRIIKMCVDRGYCMEDYMFSN